MPVVGITGGIATGKSTFARVLLRHLPGKLFDADDAARDLLENDAAVRANVRKAFGDAIVNAGGTVDRARLRDEVFADEAKRRHLENILHPAIRRRWTTEAQVHTAPGTWFMVDIPLLFETAAEAHFDHVIVVACSPATQRRRLRARPGLDDALADRMIAAQLDLDVKIAKADHLIWNDSTTDTLENQAALLAGWLRHCHG
jgi:dephospho-CoA kinase